ncbi:hypothetical protein PPGU19_055250 [Paraburkholderia sp. PGU19]|nr:hypothetical protein PPGU19_055250 [Paraburkholderia sp. PGU19]
MQAAIEIAGVIERRDAIFLCPIDLEVRERLVVEASDQRMHMRVRALLGQVRRMLLARALEVPEVRNAILILPMVKSVRVTLRMQKKQIAS